MELFRKLVVASEFGASSQRAVEIAIDIARRYGAELVLVHALEPFTPPYPILLLPEPGNLDAAAEQALAQEAERAREHLPALKHQLLHGAAAAAITKFAEEVRADLVVVGTHGRKAPSR